MISHDTILSNIQFRVPEALTDKINEKKCELQDGVILQTSTYLKVALAFCSCGLSTYFGAKQLKKDSLRDVVIWSAIRVTLFYAGPQSLVRTYQKWPIVHKSAVEILDFDFKNSPVSRITTALFPLISRHWQGYDEKKISSEIEFLEECEQNFSENICTEHPVFKRLSGYLADIALNCGSAIDMTNEEDWSKTLNKFQKSNTNHNSDKDPLTENECASMKNLPSGFFNDISKKDKNFAPIFIPFARHHLCSMEKIANRCLNIIFDQLDNNNLDLSLVKKHITEIKHEFNYTKEQNAAQVPSTPAPEKPQEIRPTPQPIPYDENEMSAASDSDEEISTADTSADTDFLAPSEEDVSKSTSEPTTRPKTSKSRTSPDTKVFTEKERVETSQNLQKLLASEATAAFHPDIEQLKRIAEENGPGSPQKVSKGLSRLKEDPDFGAALENDEYLNGFLGF